VAANQAILTYDAENRLSSVSGSGSATFVYDGDGKRVKATIGSVTTAYIGAYFEWDGTTSRSYYYAGSLRIATRLGTALPNYILGDNLGSTSMTLDNNQAVVAETRYKAYGEEYAAIILANDVKLRQYRVAPFEGISAQNCAANNAKHHLLASSSRHLSSVGARATLTADAAQFAMNKSPA
jgi:hypothetical protein